MDHQWRIDWRRLIITLIVIIIIDDVTCQEEKTVAWISRVRQSGWLSFLKGVSLYTRLLPCPKAARRPKTPSGHNNHLWSRIKPATARATHSRLISSATPPSPIIINETRTIFSFVRVNETTRIAIEFLT